MTLKSDTRSLVINAPVDIGGHIACEGTELWTFSKFNDGRISTGERAQQALTRRSKCQRSRSHSYENRQRRMAASEARDVLLLLLLAWDCTSYDCFVNVHTIVARVHRYPRQAVAAPDADRSWSICRCRWRNSLQDVCSLRSCWCVACWKWTLSYQSTAFNVYLMQNWNPDISGLERARLVL